MREEEKLLSGMFYQPDVPELIAIKLKSHNLCTAYNKLFQDETEERGRILKELFAEIGEGSFIQGPIYIHYGTHTHIGKHFFGNFNLTIQDDSEVWIGDYCNFGTGVTIVTPSHPLIASERREMKDGNGNPAHVCWAKPVHIGNDCWFGANVTVCPGVTIGDGCVIGAGSVVTKDIPANSIAAGVPCRVIRQTDESDSVVNMGDILGEYHL